jgi:hypothetical protein
MEESVILKIKIPAETAAKYEAMAASRKCSLEAAAAQQLSRFADVASDKPIVLSDDERRAVERAAKRNVGNGADVVKIVVRASTISCDGHEIAVDPNMLDRIKRLTPKRMTYPEFLGTAISRMIANSAEF